jgi:hypothetical protein
MPTDEHAASWPAMAINMTNNRGRKFMTFPLSCGWRQLLAVLAAAGNDVMKWWQIYNCH